MGLLSKIFWFLVLLILFIFTLESIGLAGAIIADSIASVLITWLTGWRNARKRGVGRTRVSVDSMSLGRFLWLLLVIAIVAIIFSPSVIGIQRNVRATIVGTSSPLDTSSYGTSLFFNSLRNAGYTVVLANNTNDINLGGSGRVVFMMIGPDTSLTDPALVNSLWNGLQREQVSFLIAEGNRTNNVPLLTRLFQVTVSGAAITDPDSNVSSNKEVFSVNSTIGSETVPVIVDVGSPIVIGQQSGVLRWQSSGETSRDSFDSSITTRGPRTVLATGQSVDTNVRTAIVSDSAPFTNYAYNSTHPAAGSTVGEIERNFTSKLVDWVTHGDKSARLIYDNSHYTTAKINAPIETGLRVGPLVALILAEYIQATGNFYDDFVNGLGPVLGAIFGLFLVYGVYAGLRRWYASEKTGKDDQPVPQLEKSIVAQSMGRQDFLGMMRDKGFYVARTAQLYESLNDVVTRELGVPIDSLSFEQLTDRLGGEEARKAIILFRRLWKIHQYAERRRKYIFPPVFGWKHATKRNFEEAEDFLNKVGLTMTGTGVSRSLLEYRLRR